MAAIELCLVQRAGGWKTAIKVQRLAHLPQDDMRAAVEWLAGSEADTQSDTRGFRGIQGEGVTAEEEMVTRLGIEPRTPGLKGRYSAN